MLEADKLVAILESVARIHEPNLEATLRSKLMSREREVLDWLMKQYQDVNKRRWYDPLHILFSTNFAIGLADAENISRLIVTGTLLHDIGYFAIEDKNNWSNHQARITHMQEGTALAAGVLVDCGYTRDEIVEVLGMIAVHDNPYLGIDIHGKARLGMRDCDRVWVMHMASFYKDVASRDDRMLSPGRFLTDRVIQFYGWAHPFENIGLVSIEQVKRNAQRIEVPTFAHTQALIFQQFESRISELDTGIFNDPVAAEDLMHRQIQVE